MNNWVYDEETIVNLFLVVFEHFTKDEKKVFVIHRLRNDIKELDKFLTDTKNNKEFLISYNGLAFDSQILTEIMNNNLFKGWLDMDGDTLARLIYKYAQKTIEKTGQPGQFSDYPEWKLPHRQIDLFKLNHWDGAAKHTSLKWLQFAMDWHNVQEMPISHTQEINTQEEIDTVLEYCYNDVSSTKAVMMKSKDMIDLRRKLTVEYGINLYNASEPRLSKELFSHFLSQELDMDKKTLKNLRTPRPKIVVNDIIVPYLKFQTEEFKRVESHFRNMTILDNVKGDKYGFSTDYKGMSTDYGLGGLHGARSGIYSEGEGYIIMTSDVESFYPNLAIKNKWAPAQFPQQQFCDRYEWFFNERKKIPKTDPKNYVYKIILNSTYGLSKDENCFLYDPLFTMKITINGQLLLSMLYEMLSEGIPGSVPLMQNTDGLELMIPEKDKQKYLDICDKWQQITSLKLEHDQYSNMMIWDVNNYIAVNKKGKVKAKGRFEWEDLDKKLVGALHKNKSFLVIPKAIYAYFINGIKPEDYLISNRNIFDYCGAVRAKGDWYFNSHKMTDNKVSVTKQQKLVRYFVSTEGEKLVKCNPDGREIQVESGKWLQTIFNKFEDRTWKEYNVNEMYYISQIYQEISSIKSISIKQLLSQRKYIQQDLF